MSGFWASRPLVRVAALAAILTLGVSLAPAHARGRVTVQTDDGRKREVHIDSHGITVSAPDSADENGSITIRGDFDAGPIVVRSDGSGIVRLFSDAEVGPGERVTGDVVAVFGSVRIEGEVTGSAVAVLGSLDLRPGALVRGDAVAVGGGLREDPGARVTGQTVQVGFLPLTLGLPGLPVVLSCIVFAWLISLFFGWLMGVMFPHRLARVAVTSSRRTAASFALGLVSGPLVIMAMLLLMVTVIGIPIAVFLPLAHLAITYLGQIAATYVLGCKLTRRRLGEGSITAPLAAGSLLVASVLGFGAILWATPGVVRTAALFFVMVGGLLLIGLSCIGTGAFLLSRAGSRPRDLDVAGPAGAPAPAPGPGAVAG
jgi:hypothetical protein